MQQYQEIKSRHPTAILFFRMGDFYEMFYEDAETASRVLGLTLTARNNGGAAEVPLAGIPVKAGPEYLRRLVQHGYRVAICEQVEDPRLAKGIVRREVVETISPGVAFADDLLDGGRNNFVVALTQAGTRLGVAAADVSTGEFHLATVPATELDAMLARYTPRELVVARGGTAPARSSALDGVLITEREAWEFDVRMAQEDLARHFAVRGLDGLGVEADDAAAVGAAGALLRYLKEMQPAGVPQLARPTMERGSGVMPLDEMTRRNLELVESLRGGDASGTLLGVLDRTMTPMGARLLRQWLLAPLVNRESIDRRLDAVGALVHDASARDALRAALDGVRDLERLGSKAAAGRATPRELASLGVSLGRLPDVERAATRLGGAGAIGQAMARWDGCAQAALSVRITLVERPPLAIGDDATIASGVDDELDGLRALRDGGKDAIAAIQAEERTRTGISSLKVGFNRVFGYYIEVTNAHRDAVPPDYQRRQTLTGAERYVTPALKEYEEKVLTASERIESRERELFEALRRGVGREIERIQCAARVVAELDVLAALADTAAREGYVRPTMTDDFALEITSGRHPVVERMMPRDKFIPNDVRLTDDARVVILTGPNMAGKSTILRLVGLTVLMAQTGSFVPAASAIIGVCDRLFTRVGASDNLVRGQSTFMVEMSETSAILHAATRRSLVLLDEIGRGTSTYDGVSIAWAVSEHLHDQIGCKTIFATHYHELVQLEQELVAVRNYSVGVREVGDQILFLHRLARGGADKSYGVDVGRLAGLPPTVIERARRVLALLEGEGERLVPALSPARGHTRDSVSPAEQLALFSAVPHEVVTRLRSTDVNALTPLAALQLLAELSERARQ
ncbi:MAG: DNA mismatch repair protein MutS [Gemmatimonadaceae bacterium]|nr:DNA mismatch repair protein MutS [Gemmatimonadaceae bacterium]